MRTFSIKEHKRDRIWKNIVIALDIYLLYMYVYAVYSISNIDRYKIYPQNIKSFSPMLCTWIDSEVSFSIF